MELKDLKSAWDKVSVNERNIQLPEEEISKILKKRTFDISAKIGRNIRIGLIIVIAWICIQFIVDYILSPLVDNKLEKIALSEDFLFWMARIEVSSYLLIIFAIIIFWLKYNKIEKTKIDSTNLKDKLILLINILNSYKKMFYIILGVIIVGVIASFSTGFIEGINYQMNELGFNFNKLSFLGWLIAIIGFVISLFIITTIYYLLFTLFFKRLYGRYLKQLKTTLKELEEPDLLSK